MWSCESFQGISSTTSSVLGVVISGCSHGHWKNSLSALQLIDGLLQTVSLELDTERK